MQAINDYVIAEEVVNEEETVSGIFLGTANTDFYTATVTSVGEGVKYLSGNEEIMFLRQNAKVVLLNGVKHLIVKGENVILKL